MKYICPLDKCPDARTAGGKAFNLSRLSGAGFNVPRGFVLTSAAFEETFCAGLQQLRETAPAGSGGSRLPGLRENALRAVFPAALGQELREAFTLLAAPLAAVRSSAEAEDGAGSSFAGQFESFLGVKAGGLEAAVKSCWASAFNPRAHSYREGFRPRMAVIVQEIVEAEVSGVAFSCHPVTGDRGTVVIEAVHGLCGPLVDGSITPDHYLVDKARFGTRTQNSSPQREGLAVSPAGGTALFQLPEELRGRPKLDEEMLRRIARAAVSIENLFKTPVDLEWAVKSGELHFLQARPVTGLLEHK